jgi:hypothetical protein
MEGVLFYIYDNSIFIIKMDGRRCVNARHHDLVDNKISSLLGCGSPQAQRPQIDGCQVATKFPHEESAWKSLRRQQAIRNTAARDRPRRRTDEPPSVAPLGYRPPSAAPPRPPHTRWRAPPLPSPMRALPGSETIAGGGVGNPRLPFWLEFLCTPWKGLFLYQKIGLINL